MSSQLLYSPSEGLYTYLDDFRDVVSRSHGVTLGSYHDLHDFSVSRPNDFWMSLWQYLDIKATVQPTKAVDESLRIDQFPQFYEDAKFNFAENMLCKTGSEIVIKSMNEVTMWSPQDVSWDQLRELVRSFADAMLSSGLKAGEVVITIGSNSVTSLALLLATSSISAIFASFATDMGEKALYDRMNQLNPRLVFSEISYQYNGKTHQILDKVATVFSRITKPHNSELVVHSVRGVSDFYSKDEITPTLLNQYMKRVRVVSGNTFLSRQIGRDLKFEQVPFNTPLVVMFSSGTTGTPKGIVHSHGGLVVNGKKEYRLHKGFDTSDVYFHYTNIGWTLWNISIGSLFCGSSMILYDGSPFYPDPHTFLSAIFSAGVTSFGAGPRYYSELRNAKVNPRSLTRNLKMLLSTGAVLTPSVSAWMAEAFGPVCQISFSGGTELCGSFVHGTRTLPTYAGEITVKALGMDVDVFNFEGESLPDGETGELVCKKPFPNMPVCFLNDPGKKRYFDAYFSTINRVWTHGDLIRVEPKTKGILILGRSDGVLNPSGVRFGSSEIYTTLSNHFPTEILDSLCAGQQRAQDTSENVFLFLKLAPFHAGKLNKGLETRIRQAISKDLSRRHVPHHFFEVETVPYNANGKKLEIQVKSILRGGEKALGKLKVGDEERNMLADFVKYFYIEDVVIGNSKPKL